MSKDIRILQDGKEEFFAATCTDAVGHLEGKCELTKLLETYNLNLIWPGDDYTIDKAITKLTTELRDSQKVPGVQAEFTNAEQELERWEYFGGGHAFNDILGWRRIDSGVLKDLENTVFPLTCSLGCSSYVAEVGVPVQLKFNFLVTRKGKGDVFNEATVYFPGMGNEVHSKTYSVHEDVSTYTTNTYTLTAILGGQRASDSKSVVFVHPGYYGAIGPTGDVGSAEILALQRRLAGSKGLVWDNINLDYGRTCYAYPKYFGNLSSIKDANNFEYIGSYKQTTVKVGEIDYLVYTLKEPTTIRGAKQIFS